MPAQERHLDPVHLRHGRKRGVRQACQTKASALGKSGGGEAAGAIRSSASAMRRAEDERLGTGHEKRGVGLVVGHDGSKSGPGLDYLGRRGSVHRAPRHSLISRGRWL